MSPRTRMRYPDLSYVRRENVVHVRGPNANCPSVCPKSARTVPSRPLSPLDQGSPLVPEGTLPSDDGPVKDYSPGTLVKVFTKSRDSVGSVDSFARTRPRTPRPCVDRGLGTYPPRSSAIRLRRQSSGRIMVRCPGLVRCPCPRGPGPNTCSCPVSPGTRVNR